MLSPLLELFEANSFQDGDRPYLFAEDGTAFCASHPVRLKEYSNREDDLPEPYGNPMT